jgi:hypothetical protein
MFLQLCGRHAASEHAHRECSVSLSILDVKPIRQTLDREIDRISLGHTLHCLSRRTKHDAAEAPLMLRILADVPKSKMFTSIGSIRARGIHFDQYILQNGNRSVHIGVGLSQELRERRSGLFNGGEHFWVIFHCLIHGVHG